MTFAIEQQSQCSFQWLYQTFGDDGAVCGLHCNPGFIFFIRPVFLTLYASCWSLVLKCQGQLKFTSKTSYSRTSHSFNVVPMLDGTSCPERRSTLSPHHRAGPGPAPALALAFPLQSHVIPQMPVQWLNPQPWEDKTVILKNKPPIIKSKSQFTYFNRYVPLMITH